MELLEGPMFADGSVRQSGFKKTELVQVSERTEMMIKDLKRLGAEFYKTYRMYSLSL